MRAGPGAPVEDHWLVQLHYLGGETQSQGDQQVPHCTHSPPLPCPPVKIIISTSHPLLTHNWLLVFTGSFALPED